ncbi:hypothetical protein DCAR_0730262 [Daucus carota subsp. sativus]|uniref:Uncharacterized protein n=1 Tax=Daucus carota subsp. sativus TaxID=79200 RepID=A0AAF1B939_DAUCS|nr:hypothetical protein DCAR_0730262 [Daucus carota subsp. sativus]
MTRRCSHCSNNGHNSRTCPTRPGGPTAPGVRLFGVRLTDGSIIKKSASMGNLSAFSAVSPNPPGSPCDALLDPTHVPDEYLSDDPAHASCSTNRRVERKKGTPWTEEEHRMFLLGLQKLGKGDWRGISRNFVISRTPTQVASHAQKYFIRQTNSTRRKRRSSLFDMVSEIILETDKKSSLPSLVLTPPVVEEQFMLPPQAIENDKKNSLPSLGLSLKTDYGSTEDTHMEDPRAEMVEDIKESVTTQAEAEIQQVIPSFYPAYIPVTFQLWPSSASILEEEKGTEASHHEVLKPIAVLRKEPVNVDELVGMSQLSIGETDTSRMEPSALTLKLLGEPSRQSAFHPSTPVSASDVSKGNGSSVIQAV